MRIKATFIGKSGSLGYVHQEYTITIDKNYKNQIIVSGVNIENVIYDNIIKFLENWDKIQHL